ncbi:MAG: hypothetical protein NC328_00990 [Muribaculum sp.]|nr:hypothetical protein [Muribaculum sp.]
MGYTFIIIILLLLTWPIWSKWLFSLIRGWMEDRVRRTFGMPTRKEEEKIRKAQAEAQRRSREERQHSYGGYNRSQRYSRSSEGRIIPPEYAVDVEYTEIKEFGQTEISSPAQKKKFSFFRSTRQTACVVEDQVEDAIYEETKGNENSSPETTPKP